MERCLVVVVGRVDVGAAGEEEVGDFCVARFEGVVERGFAGGGVGEVDGVAFGEEGADHGGLFAGGGPVEAGEGWVGGGFGGHVGWVLGYENGIGSNEGIGFGAVVLERQE